MKVDYTRRDTWKRYNSGDCKECLADCCRLPVEVKLSELVCLGYTTDDEIEHELHPLIKRLKKEKLIRLYDQSRGIATLTTHADGGCLFLDKNRLCTIYEKRPMTCRDFPKIGPRPNFCPKRNA